MSSFQILRYIVIAIIILFILFSSIYYIKPFKNTIACNSDDTDWILENEIKKFTNLEDIYIKNKK